VSHVVVRRRADRDIKEQLVDLHDFANHFALDKCKAFVAAEVGVGELMLVEAELVQDGRVDVAEVVGLLDRVQTDRVGGADDLASADAAAGHPHAEAEVVMIAASA